MCQQFPLNTFHFNGLWVTQTFLVRWRLRITWWKTGWVRSLTLPFVLLTWAIWFYTEWFGLILHEEVGEIPLLLPLMATIIKRRKQRVVNDSVFIPRAVVRCAGAYEAPKPK